MTEAEFTASLRNIRRETPEEHDARVADVAAELAHHRRMTFYALEYGAEQS